MLTEMLVFTLNKIIPALLVSVWVSLRYYSDYQWIVCFGGTVESIVIRTVL